MDRRYSMQVLIWFLVTQLTMVIGCSSKFVVNSDPVQADVYFKDAKTGEKKSLGVTPLNLPTTELGKILGPDVLRSEFVSVTIEKKGFKPQTFTIPMSGFGVSVRQLDVKLESGKIDEEVQLARELIERLFLAQRFANLNQFERALIEVDKIIEQAPGFARALSMKGSIYFAQKNYQESLKWYDEALKIDPQMEETVKLSAKARQALGGRLPASALPTKSEGGR